MDISKLRESYIDNRLQKAKDFVLLFLKRLKNRTPQWLKDYCQKHVMPYLSILVVSIFVFISGFVQASENSEILANVEVMNLSPGEVAQTVNVINPYTPNLEEDSIQVALALQDSDYLNKPIIAETVQTQQIEGARKSTITYTVEDGDTLSTIGWKYGLKITTIKAQNGLTSDMIKPGQKLKLPPQDVSTTYLAQIKQKTTTKTAFTGTFGRPTRGWNISQWFGRTSFERWHTGIDLTSRSGTAILASASGQVVAVRRGWGGGYGNHIIINHGNGFSTLYGHLSAFNVSQGQWVNQGQQIGVMGNTGWSTGTHLHFEIRKNNVAQNPMSYL